MTELLTTDQPCPLCGGHGQAFDHNKILTLIDKVAVQRAPRFNQHTLAAELHVPVNALREILCGRAKWTCTHLERLLAMDKEPEPAPKKFEILGKSVYSMTRAEMFEALEYVCSLVPHLRPI